MAFALTRFALLAGAVCLAGADKSSQFPGMSNPTKIGPFQIPNPWKNDKHPEDHPLNPINILNPNPEMTGAEEWEPPAQAEPALDLDSTAAETALGAESGSAEAKAAFDAHASDRQHALAMGTKTSTNLFSSVMSGVAFMIRKVLFSLRWVLSAPFKFLGSLGHFILPVEADNRFLSADDKVLPPPPPEGAAPNLAMPSEPKMAPPAPKPSMAWGAGDLDDDAFDGMSGFLQTDAAKRAARVTGARKRGNLAN